MVMNESFHSRTIVMLGVSFPSDYEKLIATG
jgi:hypothetical protein